MLSLEEMEQMLQDRNLMYVSQCSGVSYSSVHRIRSGKGGSVKHSNVKRLSDYLERSVFPERIKNTVIREK